MIIYKTTNKINNKTYIGQTIFSLKIRKERHLWDVKAKKTTIYFHKAIKNMALKILWRKIQKDKAQYYI